MLANIEVSAYEAAVAVVAAAVMTARQSNRSGAHQTDVGFALPSGAPYNDAEVKKVEAVKSNLPTSLKGGVAYDDTDLRKQIAKCRAGPLR